MGVSKERKRRNLIVRDMLDQLEREGIVGEQYIDMVDEYARLYDVKNKLFEDIRARGMTIEVETKHGTEMKNNPSIDQHVRVVNQMIRLRESIGIKPSQYSGGEDNEL